MLTKLGYLTRPIARATNTTSNPNTPWLPTDLSSLYGWWDASDPTTIQEANNAGRVSQWNDKSSQGNHLSQINATNQPDTGTTTINGLNSFAFGGAAAHFLSPDGALTGTLSQLDAQDVSIHVVFRQSNTNSTGALISLKSTNGSDSIMPNFSSLNRYYGPNNTGSSYRIINPSPFDKSTVHLLGFESNATDISLYRNGILEVNEGTSAVSNFFNRFVLGYRTSANRLWVGEIGEIIISNALNTADRQAVEGYLANKWGV